VRPRQAVVQAAKRPLSYLPSHACANAMSRQELRQSHLQNEDGMFQEDLVVVGDGLNKITTAIILVAGQALDLPPTPAPECAGTPPL
jgi:hypothetical protein